MKRGRRTEERLAAAGGLAIALIFGQRAGAGPASSEPPAVEYVEVEGQACLQPVVHRAGAQLADYRAAEARWLASKYPGVPTPQAKTELLLSPADDAGGQPVRIRVQRETFYLDGIVGAGAATCFDINLDEQPGDSHE